MYTSHPREHKNVNDSVLHFHFCRYEYTPAAVVAIGVSAVLGLLVSLSTFLVIGATSSLTYNVRTPTRHCSRSLIHQALSYFPAEPYS